MTCCSARGMPRRWTRPASAFGEGFVPGLSRVRDRPASGLARSIKLSLRTRGARCSDYANNANPPVLHRKETFLPADHPLHAKFAWLTQQEEEHGLLDDTATIGTKEGWQRRLHEKGLVVRGHRLVRRGNQEGDEKTGSRNHEIRESHEKEQKQ